MGITERPTLVVGVDFANSQRVAWGFKDRPDDVDLIQSWPGGGNATSQKVPTVFSYEDKGVRWGYQVDQSAYLGKKRQPIRGVKLLLDESQKYRYDPAKESEKTLKTLKRSPVEASGDYLGKIVAHARDILLRRFGTALEAMDLQYVLTVPAVWSDKAKDSTRQAAYAAGIDFAKLTLLSEPEAAAVYAIRTMVKDSATKGDCFVVCDAGGGTVDIITYRVNEVAPMRFEEVTEGTGAVCGSVMLDERFDALIRATIEKKSGKRLPEATAAAAMKYWQDYIKPGYTGPLEEDEYDDPGYWVPVPGVVGIKEVELSQGHLYVDKSQVKDIFDPIVDQIQELISEQRNKVKELGDVTKAVILVGGLGASQYLFARTQAAAGGIQVIQPPNAWSAVVRGAVHRGQEGNQVDGRIARASYGVKHEVTWDPLRYSKEEAHWSTLTEAWLVSNRMSWFINKQQPLSESMPIKKRFWRQTPTRNPSLKFEDILYFCSEDQPPSKIDSSAVPLCAVKSDLTRVPRELFDTKTNSKGESYYDITFDLVFTPVSAGLLFSLDFNGMSYGSVRASY
ncbi:uncharacterized protein N7506_008385 [Penicillium brevicompactum]|uniref:uncharacterized protein n=1 Tax=Penicillium brevicompactum TaxID=5074 RepID=UPI002541E337|nr:uncharacterized protein N7506_008385 [Penicillium brevicompactum]KAJ5325283.1 hypothetical protein N7506_008385 [Penicillium brevicompactum]